MKRGFKLILFVIALTFSIAVSSMSAVAPLECQLKEGGCLPAETDTLHLSNYSNAHAQLANESGYGWNVCCKLTGAGSDTINKVCDGSEDSKVTALSSTTNAHVERPGETDYPEKVCLSAASGTVLCSQQLACSSSKECLFSQSSTTNAHSGECGDIAGDPYTWKNCCRYYPTDCGGLNETCCAGSCSAPTLKCENNICVPVPYSSCGDFSCDVEIGEDNASSPNYCPQDCGGAGPATIWGKVTNISGQVVSGATVTAVGKNSTSTNGTGDYSLVVQQPSGSSPYDLAVSHPDYKTLLEPNVELLDWDSLNRDFMILKDAQGCNADCTRADGFCHAECNGKGLCSYPSQETASACDLAAPGIIEDPSDPSKQILCCKGGSYTPEKANVRITCGKNAISVRIPVLFKGKFTNMVLTLFDAAGCN